MGGAADDDGELSESCCVEGGAGCGCDEDAFFAREVDGLAVGALGGDGGHAGFGEADGMFAGGGCVNLLVVSEEGDHRNIDAWFEIPSGGGVVTVGAVHDDVYSICGSESC